MFPKAPSTIHGDGVQPYAYFHPIYGAYPNTTSQEPKIRSSAPVSVTPAFNHAPLFYQPPMQFNVGGRILPAADLIAPRYPHMVVPNHGGGFIFRSGNQINGAIPVQYAQQQSAMHNKVRPLGIRGVSNMHENGLLLGLNDHQIIQSFQQEYTPRVTSMQPANSPYYSQSLLPASVGTFQQLLQRVSSPNWNLQPMHQEITTTQLESSMGTNFRAHANHKQSVNNTNVNDVNVVELSGDDEEDNISNDDENEYHQSDDEEFDQVVEEEAETQRMANMNINADIGDKSIEYEIVDIYSHGRAVQPKRY